MSNPKRSASSFVLGLGPSVITLLQAIPGGDRTYVAGRWEVDMPPGAMLNGAVQEPARLTAALRALWRKAGLRGRSVSVVLPTASYSMRNLRLPDLPQPERRAVVRGELEQSGALPFGGGAFDFVWMGTGRGEAADVYAYFVADASVLPLREALDEAGLVLERLEPASLATLRAYLSTLAGQRPMAVLCPSERYTDLCIHDGQEVRLLRRIPAGYADIHMVADSRGAPYSPVPEHAYLGGSEEEPDSYRREIEAPIPQAVWGEGEGLIGFATAPAAPELPPPPRPSAPAPPETLAPPRERSLIEEEVARSLAFYAREYQDHPFPTALAIVGHGETVPLFERLLADAVPVPVVGVDLLRELNIPAPQVSAHHLSDPSLVAAAAGAAIGSAGHTLGVPALHVGQEDGRIGLRARERRRLVYVGLTGAAVFLAVAAGGAAVMTLLEMEKYSQKMQLRAQIQQVEAERAPILRYHEVSQAARSVRTATQIPVGSALGRVAAATNRGISLKTLQLGADGKLNLEGRAGGTASLERFGRDLAAGSTVRLPVIESVRRTPEGSVDFRVSALAGKPPAPKEPEKGGGE